MKEILDNLLPSKEKRLSQKIEIANTLENPVYNPSLSKEYQDEWRLWNPHQFMAYKTLLDEVGSIEGQDVLDLACGSGDSSRILAEKGAHVVGVDISRDMIGFANQKKDKYIEYLLADASLPVQYKEFRFDKVVAAFLLNYANSVEKLNGMLKNVALNLESWSEFVTITISPDHPIVLPWKNWMGWRTISRWSNYSYYFMD